MNADYPILEFDPENSAILNPQTDHLKGKLPKKAVFCFFQEVLQAQCTNGRLEKIDCLRSEIGENPIYTVDVGEECIAVVHPGVGAPLAAAFLEELINAGVSQFVGCGGAGALVKDLAAGHVLIPVSAVRDEGTSYHYLPPDRESYPSTRVVKVIDGLLKREGVPYDEVKTWTTDGIFRETQEKRRSRIEEDCQVVEMEAAALFAVAEFRKVELGMLLYAGDLVVPEGWDGRRWSSRLKNREFLFELALLACAEL